VIKLEAGNLHSLQFLTMDEKMAPVAQAVTVSLQELIDGKFCTAT
jgi:hypothetical protein